MGYGLHWINHSGLTINIACSRKRKKPKFSYLSPSFGGVKLSKEPSATHQVPDCHQVNYCPSLKIEAIKYTHGREIF